MLSRASKFEIKPSAEAGENEKRDRLMEEKKKKKQEEKKKKEAAQKKAAEQNTKVPDSAKPSPLPCCISSVSLPAPPVCSSGNGKRSPGSAQPPQPPPAPRYPPREVPPRFRQHEHKQLLKRGQTGAHSPPQTPTATANTNTSQTFPGTPAHRMQGRGQLSSPHITRAAERSPVRRYLTQVCTALALSCERFQGEELNSAN
ncbi:hypothetical protein SKAU_G00204070 [Synaphobranchus kaupii]|uniref:Uncharacterized protein n=1 Tax=Synaphobranchus kaupii TaxID=118154 RepID=A0A9Q1FGJ8_SYNKA|nr:hypothetical protein SKAU_G00204070 [Synaphobranchus kaupii]